MKSEATIRRQIRRLERLSINISLSRECQSEAYHSYHSLRWVLEDVSWTPASIIPPPGALSKEAQP